MSEKSSCEAVLKGVNADLIAAYKSGDGAAEVEKSVRERVKSVGRSDGNALRDMVVANRSLRNALNIAEKKLDSFVKYGYRDLPVADVLSYAKYIGDTTSAPPGYAPPNPLYNGFFAFPSSDMMLSSALRQVLSKDAPFTNTESETTDTTKGIAEETKVEAAAPEKESTQGEKIEVAQNENSKSEERDDERPAPSIPQLMRQDSELGRKRQREKLLAQPRKRGKLSLGFSDSDDSSDDESDY